MFYLLSINTTLQRIRNIVPLRYINSLIDYGKGGISKVIR